MSELEAAFLGNSLGMFRNREAVGRGTPRANVSVARAYKATDFYSSVSDRYDLLHLIAHSDATTLQTGTKTSVTTTRVKWLAERGRLTMPRFVLSTSCRFDSAHWRDALKAAGVELFIASPHVVTPANLTAFDMSFYSALLSRVHRGKKTRERVQEAYRLANKHYETIHASGTPHAKFVLQHL